MNNALKIGSNIDATSSGVKAIEHSHTNSTSGIQQTSPVRPELVGGLTHMVASMRRNMAARTNNDALDDL